MDSGTRKRIKKVLRVLAEDPRSPRAKADIRKLTGVKDGQDLFRLRIGEYRVMYEVSGRTVWITEIVKRGSAYKFLF